MARPLLRSGKLSNYLALGENGQTVFDSALQIRETLRIRGMPNIANCLAIPQKHDDDDRVDWYAPVNGKPVSWLKTSLSERELALEKIREYHDVLNNIQLNEKNKDNVSLQLFTALVKLVLECPGTSYLWIINEQPIMTFWGFYHPQRQKNLSFVDELTKEVAISLAPEPHETHSFTKVAEDNDLPFTTEAEAPASPETQVEENQNATISEQKTEKNESKTCLPYKSLRDLWIVILLSFVAIAILLFTGFSIVVKQSQQRVIHDIQQETQETQETLYKNVTEEKAIVDTKESVLPRKNVQVKAIPSPPASPVKQSADKNAMILFPNSIKAGSIRFLNGTWTGKVMMDSDAKQSLDSLRISIYNGKGQLKVYTGRNTCQSTMQIGLLPSGTLSMKSRPHARCQDGSVITVPDISCKAGPDDIAYCRAKWVGVEAATVTFTKVKG